MKDFKSLKILDFFKSIFSRFGVDYAMMRTILQIKLTMDERRAPTLMMGDTDTENLENKFNKSLLMYALMGFIFMLFLLPDFPLFYKMNIIITMILFLATSIMVSDYSSVLLDIKEKNILLPKPIDMKTINTARILHIFIYLFTIILAIALPTLIAGFFKYGILFGAIFLVQLLFIASFIIFLTSLLYFFLLYFFNGEKLKDVINYFQIGFSIAMIFIYQLVGELFKIFNFEIVYTVNWWHYLVPTVWFAAPYSYFIEDMRSVHFLNFALIGIVIPILMLVLYFRVVSPYFEGVLQKLHHNSAVGVKGITKKETRRKKIAAFFSSNPIENVFYRFAQNMVSSERTLKLKLYPSLAFATILPLVFLLRTLTSLGSLEESYQFLIEGNYFLYLYFSVTMLSNAVPLLGISEKHKAAWIYQTLPIEDINDIYKGTLKGYMMKYILPIHSIISLIFLGLYGLTILADVLIIFLVLLILILIIFNYSDKPLPFSEDFQYIKYNNMSVLFKTFIFCGISAGIHFFLISSDYTRIPYFIILFLALIILWKKIFPKKDHLRNKGLI